jgi:hypothetical protein
MEITRSEYESLPSWLSVFTKDFQVGDRFRKDTVTPPLVVLIQKPTDTRYRFQIQVQEVQLVE